MDQIKVRKANNYDLATLIDFEQQIIRAEREFDSSLEEGEIHYYNFADLIVSPKARALIAEINNEIAGSGYAEIKEAQHYLKHSEFAYIGLMYVKPAYRGKGINQYALQFLKEWIIEQKIAEIRLVVYDENTLAKNAYLKAGFKAHVLEMRMEI